MAEANLTILEIGLTKREYFSALCLQGMLANPTLYAAASAGLNPDDFPDFYAKIAIEHADGLITELNKNS